MSIWRLACFLVEFESTVCRPLAFLVRFGLCNANSCNIPFGQKELDISRQIFFDDEYNVSFKVLSKRYDKNLKLVNCAIQCVRNDGSSNGGLFPRKNVPSSLFSTVSNAKSGNMETVQRVFSIGKRPWSSLSVVMECTQALIQIRVHD